MSDEQHVDQHDDQQDDRPEDRHQEGRGSAVIVNPSKFHADGALEQFRTTVTQALTAGGYAEPLWLETTEDDPGRAMTEQAREAGVELVLAAGGDGTVRVVAAGLSGSDIAMGILPMGTANLLARNLELPRKLADAIEVAVAGRERRIDLIRVTADDGEPDHFAVMAGLGADAVVMEEANPKLKKVFGSAAYVFSAAQNADHPALKTRIRLDRGERPADQRSEEIEREAALLLIGNVGHLQGKVPLIPNATPDDGRLDLLIASPQSQPGRLKLLVEVLFRRHSHDEDFDLLSGRRVEITVDRSEAYELDGDPAGHCTKLVAEIVPATLTVRVSQTED